MALLYGTEEPEERECPMCQGVMHRVVPTDGTRPHYCCERCGHTVGRTRIVFVAILAVTAILLMAMMMHFVSTFISTVTAVPG